MVVSTPGIPTTLKHMKVLRFPTEWKVIQNSMVPVTTNQSSNETTFTILHLRHCTQISSVISASDQFQAHHGELRQARRFIRRHHPQNQGDWSTKLSQKKLRQAKFKSLFQVCIRIFSILFRGCYSSKDGKPSMIWGIMRRYLVILWDMTWDIMVATTKLILGNV